MYTLKTRFLLFLFGDVMIAVVVQGKVGGKMTGSANDPSSSVVAGATSHQHTNGYETH